LISALPAEEIEEQLCLGMINDRPWTIAACSAKDREGKTIAYDKFIGLKEGLDWLIENLSM